MPRRGKANRRRLTGTKSSPRRDGARSAPFRFAAPASGIVAACIAPHLHGPRTLALIAAFKFVKSLAARRARDRAVPPAPSGGDRALRRTGSARCRSRPATSSSAARSIGSSASTRTRSALFSAIALVYATLYAIEGFGLWRERALGEVPDRDLDLPFHSGRDLGIVRHFTPMKLAGARSINIAIVAYLVWLLRAELSADVSSGTGRVDRRRVHERRSGRDGDDATLLLATLVAAAVLGCNDVAPHAVRAVQRDARPAAAAVRAGCRCRMRSRPDRRRSDSAAIAASEQRTARAFGRLPCEDRRMRKRQRSVDPPLGRCGRRHALFRSGADADVSGSSRARSAWPAAGQGRSERLRREPAGRSRAPRGRRCARRAARIPRSARHRCAARTWRSRSCSSAMRTAYGKLIGDMHARGVGRRVRAAAAHDLRAHAARRRTRVLDPAPRDHARADPRSRSAICRSRSTKDSPNISGAIASPAWAARSISAPIATARSPRRQLATAAMRWSSCSRSSGPDFYAADRDRRYCSAPMRSSPSDARHRRGTAALHDVLARQRADPCVPVQAETILDARYPGGLGRAGPRLEPLAARSAGLRTHVLRGKTRVPIGT